MAATYDLASDFSQRDELKTQVPFWVIGIVRFAEQVTYDVDQRRSVSEDERLAMAEREPLVLTSEVTQLSVSASKEAHVTNLNALLKPQQNFVGEILPGDWVACCMLNSETQGQAVAEKMRRGQKINGWRDGFKFLGKVTSCRKRIHVAPSGEISTQFPLQAVGFGEFDSTLFYHPQLQELGILPQKLEQFGALIQELVNGSGPAVDRGAIDINMVLPKLVEVIFGVGAWASGPRLDSKRPDGPHIAASPNARYLVPDTIFKWLGLRGARTYDDLLNTLMGVQHYRDVAHTTERGHDKPWMLFRPDGAVEDGPVWRTPVPLIGWFALAAPPTQASVWDMLDGYMNRPLNEMYVALRADQDGDVFPHLVVRQTPYSSDSVRGALARYHAEGEKESKRLHAQETARSRKAKQKVPSPRRSALAADATEFLELPRWRLPRSMLKDADIGRSDAARFNMVHISGSGQGSVSDEVGNFLRAPPVTDNLDILRHGVRPYITGINCTLRDLAKGPQVWRDLMADIVMGQQLHLSGQVVSLGIQAPVPPGDNLEFEGIVFHIETITHIASISEDGVRTFRTSMQVSHGIDSEQRALENEQAGQSRRTARFAGTTDFENDVLDEAIAVTVEEG